MLILATLNANSQALADFTVMCGPEYIIRKDTTVNNLIFECNKTLLIQDNATLHVRGRIIGEQGRIVYGDKGWEPGFTPEPSQIDSLQQFDMDGYEYYDKRLKTDVNPRIIVDEGCVPQDLWVGPYVDIDQYEFCPDLTLGDGEWVIDREFEMNLDCIIWNMNGIEMYRGPFSGIFDGDCGPECLNYLYWNKVLLIQFTTENGERINVKRIYVR